MERNRRREAPPSREFGDGEALGPRNWVTARGREEGGGREGSDNMERCYSINWLWPRDQQ